MKRISDWLRVGVRVAVPLIVLTCIVLGLKSTIGKPEGPEAHCQALMKGFTTGLTVYRDEYNHFPTEALNAADPYALLRTRGAILKVLYGKDDQDNPRKIIFFQPPPAKQPEKIQGTYLEEHQEPVLVDPWGEPFYFIADLKGAGKVPNPDPRDNKTHPFIEKLIIMFSAGPDHDPNTWDDNVVSWK